ncbi:MAG: magnesium transporter [Oscillospiraceae bacterium]|jgi:magnesium transporter|nr:magnesium transporter [Oscillospiraceae bacterium]
MQKILLYNAVSEVHDLVSGRFYKQMLNHQPESFIGIEDYNVIVFKWYDVHHRTKKFPQITIYIDRENIFFFCEDKTILTKVQKIIQVATENKQLSNEELLYHFFMQLLQNDISSLNGYEIRITDIEDQMVSGPQKDSLNRIIVYRRELLHVKRYYELLSFAFEELSANENGLLTDRGVRLCTILSNRTDRLLSCAMNLRDYIAQVLETYQSQLDYRQNYLMKVFTVVTTIFLPLTLLVGWYGMNFDMPELHSPCGYPIFILVSVSLVVGLILIFKKKKWM